MHAGDVVHHPEEAVTLRGWVNGKRDFGKLTFFDLRDHTGLVQCVGRGNQISGLRNEDVVEVVGKVSRRPIRDGTNGGHERSDAHLAGTPTGVASPDCGRQ